MLAFIMSHYFHIKKKSIIISLVLVTDCGFYIINVLNELFYLATFVRFYLSSATVDTFNTIWNYTFYILIPAKTRKTTLES